jgi:hypothetical protein
MATTSDDIEVCYDCKEKILGHRSGNLCIDCAVERELDKDDKNKGQELAENHVKGRSLWLTSYSCSLSHLQDEIDNWQQHAETQMNNIRIICDYPVDSQVRKEFAICVNQLLTAEYDRKKVDPEHLALNYKFRAIDKLNQQELQLALKEWIDHPTRIMNNILETTQYPEHHDIRMKFCGHVIKYITERIIYVRNQHAALIRVAVRNNVSMLDLCDTGDIQILIEGLKRKIALTEAFLKDNPSNDDNSEPPPYTDPSI